MTSFTWAKIREYYLSACKDATGAAQEFYDHATAAHRELCGRVDVEELLTDTQIVVGKDKDSTTLPEDVYSLYTVFNLTTGERVEPEEHGLRGRSRYLDIDTGQPGTGTVHRYVRAGRKLWVRSTADTATTLLVNYKRVPPDVTAEIMTERPLTPAHLDWPLIHLTAANFYRAHPEADEGGVRATELRNQAWDLATTPKPPHQEENRDRRERISSFWYRMTP